MKNLNEGNEVGRGKAISSGSHIVIPVPFVVQKRTSSIATPMVVKNLFPPA
jgi:hypothetical protein